MKPICWSENKYRFTRFENPRYIQERRQGGKAYLPNLKPYGKRFMARARRRHNREVSREFFADE